MDPILKGWLECQQTEATQLVAASSVLKLFPGLGAPPREYLARYDCPTMVHEQATGVTQQTGFDVLIRFPLDYLRAVPNPAFVVALMSPDNAFHPNVRAPFICLGDIAPGTSLCEILYQVFEIMTFQRLTPNENDALNKDACAWVRNNMERFPLGAAALRSRPVAFAITAIDEGAPQ